LATNWRYSGQHATEVVVDQYRRDRGDQAERGGQQRLVLALGCHRLVIAGLGGARVDHRQHIALLHFLAFAEVQAHQLSAHLRADGDGVHCRHRAQRAGIDRHVLACRIHHGDRHRAGIRVFTALARSCCRATGLVLAPAKYAQADHGQHQYRHDQQHDLPNT